MHPDPTRFDLGNAVALLQRTPSILGAMLRDLPAVWSHCNEGPETWSPFEVVGHLIHGERTDWIPRAEIILRSGEQQPFEPFDRFAPLRARQQLDLRDLLDTFAELRAENLGRLASWNLGDEQLDRTGIHPEFGRVTLRQLLATWVAHDLGHVHQIVRCMARQYRDAVGPWKAYLSLLQDSGPR